jgi:hypothetical protein
VGKGRLNGSQLQKVQLWVILYHINRIHSLSFKGCKAKGTVPVDDKTAYRRSRGIAPFILELGTRQIYTKTAVCVMDVSIHINFSAV